MESEHARAAVAEFVAGGLAGTHWTPTPESVHTEHTRIRVRWQADPHGIMRPCSPGSSMFRVPPLTVMQQGFHGMERYVASQRQHA